MPELAVLVPGHTTAVAAAAVTGDAPREHAASYTAVVLSTHRSARATSS